MHLDQLYPLFENLIQLYIPSNSQYGESLIDLIQSEHSVFSDDLYDTGMSSALLEDIFKTGWDDDDGEAPVDASELFLNHTQNWYHITMSEKWREFCYEAKENPTLELNMPSTLKEDLSRMEVELPKESVIYRALIGFIDDELHGPKPYQQKRIGAPPSHRAKSARANVDGEVVLYAADQERTAVAEIRPWRGVLVSVAEIILPQTLNLVDLSKPLYFSNPFTDELPQYETELEDLLIAFGYELGKPLRKKDDPNDYIPCQKLVAWIRNTGFYHGIRYPSAMAEKGTNIVIFDPSLVKIGPAKLVEITSFEIDYKTFKNEY